MSWPARVTLHHSADGSNPTCDCCWLCASRGALRHPVYGVLLHAHCEDVYAAKQLEWEQIRNARRTEEQ